MSTHAAVQAAYQAATVPLAPARTRDDILLAELPQVHFIAARIQERLPKTVAIEDLVNAGVVGLIEAYNSFDHEKNAQFRTFAKFRIRGAILDSLRSLDWGSRSLRRRGREIREVTATLEGELGRTPGQEEIAARMGISLDQLELAMSQLESLQVVGQQMTSTLDGGDLIDLIESAPSREEDPFDHYARAEQTAHLAAAVATLSEREQLVLSLYYKEGLTMKQVATVIGIALSRVSQIHNAAMVKLRKAMGPRMNRPASAPAAAAGTAR